MPVLLGVTRLVLGTQTACFRAGPATPVLRGRGRERVDKVAMPSGRGSWELPGILTTLECGWGARLSVTYVINYFLTISSVSAS